MKTKPTGTLTPTEKFFKLDKQFKAYLHTKHSAGKPIYIKEITDAKHRSEKQNAYYWSAILPAILNAIPEGMMEPEPQDTDDLHELLMWSYGIGKGLIKIIKYKGKEIPIRPSWRLDKMSHKQANEYQDHVRKWVNGNLGYDVDTLIDGMGA